MIVPLAGSTTAVRPPSVQAVGAVLMAKDGSGGLATVAVPPGKLGSYSVTPRASPRPAGLATTIE